MNLKQSVKRPVKRLVGAFKHARLIGDASVHWGTRVHGPGLIELADNARLAEGSCIDLSGGVLRMGERSRVTRGVIMRVGKHVDVGCDCSLMHYAIIYGEGGVTLGDRVLVGNHSLITSLSHVHEGSAPVFGQPMKLAPVVVDDDVWIGAYCLVEAGVTIGEGAIVAAHSYVKDDVPAMAIVGGIPARVIGQRTTEG